MAKADLRSVQQEAPRFMKKRGAATASNRKTIGVTGQTWESLRRLKAKLEHDHPGMAVSLGALMDQAVEEFARQHGV